MRDALHRGAGRLLLATTCVALVIGSSHAVAGSGGETDTGTTYVLQVGDVVRVEGSPIGCGVVRRESSLALDCRRMNRLGGSYGALLDNRRLRVVRFKDVWSAKTVLVAVHGRSAVCCPTQRP